MSLFSIVFPCGGPIHRHESVTLIHRAEGGEPLLLIAGAAKMQMWSAIEVLLLLLEVYCCSVKKHLIIVG